MVDSTNQELAQDSDPILREEPILETDGSEASDPLLESDAILESDPIMEWDTSLAQDSPQSSDPILKSDADQEASFGLLPGLLGSTSSVQKAFKAVDPDHAVAFTLNNPGAPGNMPTGFNEGGLITDYHQQGMQRIFFGGFVVTGSAPSASYFYVTGPDMRVINVTQIDKTFNHAGGIQVAGNILGVGIEKIGQSTGGSQVRFYDLAKPAAPQPLARVITRDTETAGAVGLVRALDGNHIAVVAGWDSKRLTFHRFARFDQVTGGMQSVAVTVSTSGWQKYQNINLFQDNNQALWLVGLHTQKFLSMEDWGDLYQVSIDWARGKVTMNKRENKHFHRANDGPRFLYGSGCRFDGSHFEFFSCESHMSSSGVVRCNRWPYFS